MAERERQSLGNYRLRDLLGRGDFGEVYLGERIDSGLQVAIKLLYTRVVGDEVAVFQQKARTLAKLKHRNIVCILDFDVETRTHKPYLVMDYALNGTLRERYPRVTRLSLSTMIKYVKQIAVALQYVHDEQVIHLDIKPENIQLGQNDELLLSDFGIAGLFQKESTSEYSDSYAAPEQIEGKPCPASDQYALAIMVYEWLCGQPPFSENDENNILHQHIHDPVPPLCEQLPTISPAIERVVLKALPKKPKERFDSVREFATALESEAVTSTGISRRAVLFGAGGVVGLALLGTVSWWEIKRTPLSQPSKAGRTPGTQPPGRPQGTLYLTYRGHSNVVYAVVWSPDGKRIASGSFDGTVQVWDAANGGNVITYRGHTNAVLAVAWSPDGKHIASGSFDRTAQVWDALNGSHIFIYRGHSNHVTAVAWSPDSQRIASASFDATVQVWQAV